jgi:hypothetical protein
MITIRDDFARALERLRRRDPAALAAFIVSLAERDVRDCRKDAAPQARASDARDRGRRKSDERRWGYARSWSRIGADPGSRSLDTPAKFTVAE